MNQEAASRIRTVFWFAGIYLISSVLSTATLAQSPHCDLLLHNANIVSMNAENERFTTVGIGNGQFLYVDNRGQEDKIGRASGRERV